MKLLTKRCLYTIRELEGQYIPGHLPMVPQGSLYIHFVFFLDNHTCNILSYSLVVDKYTKLETGELIMFRSYDLPLYETLGEKISAVLRKRIVSGISKPGTRLSENKLSAEFGTSRSPVRDALKTLSNEGLIRLERMGAVVLGLDKKDIEELYEVRYLIESFALKRLANMYSEEVAQRLMVITDKMEMAAKHHNHEELAHYDFLFHDYIVRQIQHNRILQLWNSMKHVVMTVLLVTTERRFSNNNEETSVLIEKHRQLIDTLKTMQAEHIEQQLQEHYSDTYNSIHKLLL